MYSIALQNILLASCSARQERESPFTMTFGFGIAVWVLGCEASCLAGAREPCYPYNEKDLKGGCGLLFPSYVKYAKISYFA
jgi:hypothetical protein